MRDVCFLLWYSCLVWVLGWCWPHKMSWKTSPPFPFSVKSFFLPEIFDILTCDIFDEKSAAVFIFISSYLTFSPTYPGKGERFQDFFLYQWFLLILFCDRLALISLCSPSCSLLCNHTGLFTVFWIFQIYSHLRTLYWLFYASKDLYTALYLL